LLGVHEVEPAPTTGDEPAGQQVVARALRYAYNEGHDVLRGIDLAPAQRSQSGGGGSERAGKSTLALLLAGVYVPRAGRPPSGESMRT